MDQAVRALKTERWKQIMHDYNQARQETGISKETWCNENGIGLKSFYHWQKMLRQDAAKQLLPTGQEIVAVNFEIPAENASSAEHQKVNQDEIILERDGLSIRLPATFPAQYVVEIIRGLK